MGCCASNAKVKVPKERRRLSVAHVDKSGAHLNADGSSVDDELLALLDRKSVIDIASDVKVGGPKTFMGSTTEAGPGGMTSFCQKSQKVVGDTLDLSAKGVAFTCRKGLKPESPNQDSWCCLKMDTFSIFAVFDGHGQKGHDISEFVKERLPKLILLDPRSKSPEIGGCLVDAFKRVQRLVVAADKQKVLNAQMSGTTATVCFIDHLRDKLTIAHVADSTAAVGSNVGGKWEGTAVTRDHKPNLKGERERIEKSGGKVVFDGYANHRVYAKNARYPGLNMSRCIGDILGHTECGITCEPEITRIDIDKQKDQLLLVCSDGVWEFITAQEAVEIVNSKPFDLSEQAAAVLAKEAWDRWIREEGGAVVDDITVGLVHIGKDKVRTE
ncbi:unnamed protein product [Effrenium voratum]|nr:unnamed protein product [Effrenium voratum]